MRSTHYLVVFTLLLLTTFLDGYSVSSKSWIKFNTPKGSPISLSSKYGLTTKCDKASIEFYESDETLGSSFGNVTVREGYLEEAVEQDGSRVILPALLLNLKSETRSSLDEDGWHCRRFPLQAKDCKDSHDFCLAWRGASYAAQLSLGFHAVSLVGLFIVLLLGGRRRRAQGYKVIGGFSSLAIALQILAMSILLNLYNNDERFYAGTKLGSAMFFQIVSWSLAAVVVVGMTAVGLKLQNSEMGEYGDGYQRFD